MKQPELNDYVVVKITEVMKYGAYAELEEYPGWKGFIHISEVASHWVKNIRSYVKEGQIRVAKVIRVYPEKKSVDLSLKRVSGAIAKRKMEALRRAKRGKYLLELASKKIGKSYEEVVPLLEEEFGDIFGAFENAALYGEEAFKGSKIPEEWRKAILEVAKKYIEVPKKKVASVVTAIVPGPFGARVLRDVLTRAKQSITNENTSVNIYVAGVPRYAVEVVSYDYKTAESVLRQVCDQIVEEIRQKGGEASWEKVKA